jgi:hypothetical protein
VGSTRTSPKQAAKPGWYESTPTQSGQPLFGEASEG